MLTELCGKGWTLAEPPLQQDEPSVIARVKGEPIRAGLVIEEADEDSNAYHKFRTGRYDIELKMDFDIARAQVRVTEADGYE